MIKATIYDRVEGIVYAELFSCMAELRYYMAIKDMSVSDVLTMIEIEKPIICKKGESK